MEKLTETTVHMDIKNKIKILTKFPNSQWYASDINRSSIACMIEENNETTLRHVFSFAVLSRVKCGEIRYSAYNHAVGMVGRRMQTTCFIF